MGIKAALKKSLDTLRRRGRNQGKKDDSSQQQGQATNNQQSTTNTTETQNQANLEEESSSELMIGPSSKDISTNNKKNENEKEEDEQVSDENNEEQNEDEESDNDDDDIQHQQKRNHHEEELIENKTREAKNANNGNHFTTTTPNSNSLSTTTTSTNTNQSSQLKAVNLNRSDSNNSKPTTPQTSQTSLTLKSENNEHSNSTTMTTASKRKSINTSGTSQVADPLFLEQDEHDDADEDHFEFIDEEDEKKIAKNSWRTLSPEQIVEQQKLEVQSISELFKVTDEESMLLLRSFQWQKEQLISKYLENPESVRKEAGLVTQQQQQQSQLSTSVHSANQKSPTLVNGSFGSSHGSNSPSPQPIFNTTTTATSTSLTQSQNSNNSNNSTPSSPKQEIGSAPIQLVGMQTCSICADEMPAEECTALACGHPFCNDCWDTYLTMKITEGETKIRCPQQKCTVLVGERVIPKLVASNVYDRYIRFVTKAFVDDSAGRIKWCPRAGCGNAITVDMVRGTVVRCSCGYRFCFSCHKEAHSPSTCDHVREWERKCQDDSETTHWKYANTKDCPKCQCPVEKNGGCNHMVCRQCKHEWCWVCMRAFRGHNDFYNCNKFVKDVATATNSPRRSSFARLTSLFKRNSARDKLREREAQRERNRIALERYLHFYQRFQAHSHSGELEKQIRAKALQRAAELQKEASTTSEVQYVLEGTDTLIQCRNVLKYTYVYAYYELESGGARRDLFEFLQEDLEKTTEQLSEFLEGPTNASDHRVKTLNIIQLAQTRTDNLLKACEQGLTETS